VVHKTLHKKLNITGLEPMIDDHTQGEHANHYPTNAVVILEGGSMSENFEGRQIKDRLSQI
jgi:hypothetical protein